MVSYFYSRATVHAVALWLLAFAVALAGCASRPDVHVVARGDTLASIGQRYDIGWRQLARRNSINAPYTIYEGQFLALSVDSSIATADAPPKQKPDPASTAALSAAAASERHWRWPADGEILRRYEDSASRQGIDIGGAAGSAVRATGAGRVVYSGSGLQGYGRLLIIKHDARYLSAYGYNRRLLVGQGSEVASGDTIAEMGVGPGQTAALHFEIRRDGQPLDPARILPPR